MRYTAPASKLYLRAHIGPEDDGIGQLPIFTACGREMAPYELWVTVPDDDVEFICPECQGLTSDQLDMFEGAS